MCLNIHPIIGSHFKYGLLNETSNMPMGKCILLKLCQHLLVHSYYAKVYAGKIDLSLFLSHTAWTVTKSIKFLRM